MTKDRKIYGIDISKSVFDIYSKAKGHVQLKNDESGFKKLLTSLPKEALVVMEATGYYHYRLAQFLYKNDVLVSVVNPLLVKRFIQMKLAKGKSKKLALIAVANKLLKQAFAIAKSGLPYDENFVSKLA
ncbi:transposase [Lacinutrix sp. MedPE-SW]|uniref:IS110 family transposase n=1 Tax=Lacinutrix sp. MedPE-SW TaxID=1860087 RepID=UPI000921055E|nr:transposase [Lacinutrix sp. MedPE-SW]OIQ18730.1 MAG: hypothetical protein BM549_11230 [Lacinutrix sp. MedPE-SW]